MEDSPSSPEVILDAASIAISRLSQLIEEDSEQLTRNPMMAKAAAQLCATLAQTTAMSSPEVQENVMRFLEPSVTADLRRDLLHLHIRLLVLREGPTVEKILERLKSGYVEGHGWPPLTDDQVQYILWQIIYGAEGGRLAVPIPQSATGLLRTVYDQMIQKVSQELSSNLSYVPFSRRDQSLIFVVNRDINLGDDTATKDLISCCQIIREKMGFSIVVINSGYDPVDSDFPLTWGIKPEKPVDLSSVGSLELDHSRVPFVQLPLDMRLCDDSAKKTVAHIARARPLLVISMSGMNPIADLCRKFTEVITVPFDGSLALARPTLFAVKETPSASDVADIMSLGYKSDDVLVVGASDDAPSWRLGALTAIMEQGVNRFAPRWEAESTAG